MISDDRVMDICIDLLDRAPEDLAAAAAEACRGDTELHRLVLAKIAYVNTVLERKPSPDVFWKIRDTLESTGKWIIEDLVGRGGMGLVFKAWDRHLQRGVAIKVLDPLLGKEPSFTKRFAREKVAGGRLGHPNLVQVYEGGTIGDLHYIVMEFIDGPDLGSLVVCAGTLPLEDTCEIVRQTCLALEYLHERKIVHRDIKPGNLLLADGIVRLLDLGICTLEEDVEGIPGLTGNFQAVGTPGYVAPEQLAGSPVDGRADLFALGCTWVYLLTGNIPGADFERSVPGEIVPILKKMMPEKAADRFPGPREVRAAVEKLIAAGAPGRVDEKSLAVSLARPWFAILLLGSGLLGLRYFLLQPAWRANEMRDIWEGVQIWLGPVSVILGVVLTVLELYRHWLSRIPLSKVLQWWRLGCCMALATAGIMGFLWPIPSKFRIGSEETFERRQLDPLHAFRSIVTAGKPDGGKYSREDWKHWRFLDATHLHNNSRIPSITIDGFRQELERWYRNIHPANRGDLRWLDAEKTVALIDLREIQWGTQNWEEATSNYPYGLDRTFHENEKLARLTTELQELAGDPIFVVRSDWWLAKNHFLEGEPASVYDRDLDDHAMAIELGFLSSKSMKGIARNSGFDLECLKILEIGKVTRQEWEAMPVQGSIYQRMARGFGKGVPLSR